MGQTIRDEVIEELLRGYSSAEDLLGEEGLFKQLKKKLLERTLGAELTEHLGYEKGDPGRPWQRQQRTRGAARPQWQLRAAARAEGSDPVRGFRRSDHQPLCPRPLGPRDPGASARALRRPSFPRSDQPGHRCRARGGAGMAEPAARPGLPSDFLRRAAGQDSRRRCGAQQSRLYRARPQHRGRKKRCSDCGSSRPRAPSFGSR
jgi:hypothetical protein